MRDNLMGGLLAFGIATPVVIVCCGGGAALIAKALGGIGAWLSGFGGNSVALVEAFAVLVVRDLRQANKRRATSETLQDRKSAT